VGLALLVFAVAGALGGLTGQFSVYELRDRIGQSLATDAQRMAERISKEIATRTRELTLLSAFDPLRNLAADFSPARAEQVQALLDGLKRSFPAYVWIGVADPDGHLLAATGGQYVGGDITTRGQLRDPLLPSFEPPSRLSANGSLQVHKIGLGQDQVVMDLVHVMQAADGTVNGLLMAQISWNVIREIERSVLTSDENGELNREAYVISPHDEVLSGPPGSFGSRLSLPAIARARAGFAGWTAEIWPDGHIYLTGTGFAAGDGPYTGLPSPETRWTVLVREKIDSAFTPAYQLRDMIFMIGAALAVAFAAIGWWLATWITRPMARIALAAERLRQGEDVELPKLRGAKEIESLSASLRALVATLTHKEMALVEAEELANRDTLTRLLNRSGLQQYLDRAIINARLSGINLIVFAADLDGFKAVNDTLGHAAGDELLREIARRLSGCARTQDAVARVGGDEFILVLEAPTGPTDGTALAIAQRMLAKVKEPVPIGDRFATVGCSFGGAAWPNDGEDVALVMQKADAALYDVKRAGKGQIRLHGARVSL
jgi:diguanylate cyclase (GGDEF)-like protein